MTIQMLVEAWKVSEAHHSMNPPATETEIQAAEKTIGTALPPLLREIYQLFNGGWMWDLEFFTALKPKPYFYSLTDGNEQFIEDGWHIPKEIRLFAGVGGEETFGIWLPCCGNPIYNHPIIEVGELHDEDCMGVVGTNLISFLCGWSAFRLMETELDESKESAFLDALFVPESLRAEHHHEDPDENFAQLRKWADPNLPDPYGNSYTQRYTIADLKKLFGAT